MNHTKRRANYRNRYRVIFSAVFVGLLMACWGVEPSHAQANPHKSDETATATNQSVGGQSQPTVQQAIGEIYPEDLTAQFSPDGKYLAVNDGSRIKLWELATGRPLRSLEHFAYFQHFVIVGDVVVSVHKDGVLRTWESATGRLVSETRIFEEEDGIVIRSFSYDAARKLAVVTAANNQVALWDEKKRTTILRVQLDFEIETASLFGDGKSIVVTGSGIAQLIDVASRAVTKTQHFADNSKERLIVTRILNGSTALVQSDWEECKADFFLLKLFEKRIEFRPIDRASGCKTDAEEHQDQVYGALTTEHTAGGAELYFARGGIEGIRVFDLASGRLTRSIPWKPSAQSGAEKIIAIDTRLGLIASAAEGEVRVLRLSNSEPVATFRAKGSLGNAYASYDETRLLLQKEDGANKSIMTWSLSSMVPVFNHVALPNDETVFDISVDAGLMLAHNTTNQFIVYALTDGREISRFEAPLKADDYLARLSPDGSKILYVGKDPDLPDRYVPIGQLVEARSGRILLTLKAHPLSSAEEQQSQTGEDLDTLTRLSFSADGHRFAVGYINGSAEIWSSDTLQLLVRCDTADDQTTSLVFSRDGRFLIGGSRDSGVYLWNADTGKLVHTFERKLVAGHVNTAGLAISPDGELIAAGPGQRGTSSGDVGVERGIEVWETATGKRRFVLRGHEANVHAIVFTDDRRWIVSASFDGTIRYWDRATGRLAATFASSTADEWVIVCDNGFFAASSNAGDLLSVVQGFKATSIEQLWQSLYAPDLVREYLAGDPNGEVNTALANTELSSILESGPAPAVEVTSTAPNGNSEQDIVTFSARITDRGKGVGRIEWRVNGVTAAVASTPKGAGPEFTITQDLALDPGENSIEVVAYNASNLLASLPTRASVRLASSADPIKPTLHVLAIGINDYVDRGWTPPNGKTVLKFPHLKLAVADAQSLADALRQAGAGQYADVKVTEALNTNATLAGLQTTIDQLASEVNSRDTFILYAAAHGTSLNGRFYLIPQDYDGGLNPVALQEHAIGQDRLQDWIANRIKAKRMIVLLDTCESGALVSGYARPRTDGAASESAIGRLHEATGRAVLTAAAEGKPAFEGYQGHGVFTWTILDALKNGDLNANGTIELSELVAYVQDKVPAIAAKLKGRGRAAIASRGTIGQRQSARFGSRGEDFALVGRIQ